MDGPHTPAHRSSRAGFTLVELVVVLAIAAILVTGVVPAMAELVNRNRQASHVNHVVASLHLARTEAITRGDDTVLCPSLDDRTCADTFRWDRGWLVFADLDRDAARDPGEPLLRIVQGLRGTRIFTSTGRRRITFRSSGARGGMGSSGGSNATFTFCRSESAQESAAVVLSNVGRARTVRPAPAPHGRKCSATTTGY